jgi:hypothetical protein
LPVSDKEKDEDGLLAGEFKGMPSLKEQLNQWLRTIESSILTDLILRETTQWKNDTARNILKPVQCASKIKTTITSTSTYRILKFSKIKKRTNVQNSLIQFFAENQIASNLNVENRLEQTAHMLILK